ncbi:hypothetical protein EDB87DRAFT_1683823 [Lactarius vividus]|nr:hypothetical protein EDB87DRAFT_1683823 [Lactarius vividus]
MADGRRPNMCDTPGLTGKVVILGDRLPRREATLYTWVQRSTHFAGACYASTRGWRGSKGRVSTPSTQRGLLFLQPELDMALLHAMKSATEEFAQCEERPDVLTWLDEEDAPIAVMTVHPETASAGVRFLHLETMQTILHRRAERIQSIVAESVHYVDVPLPKGAWIVYTATSPDVAADHEKYKEAYIELSGNVIQPAHEEVHDRAMAMQL